MSVMQPIIQMQIIENTVLSHLVGPIPTHDPNVPPAVFQRLIDCSTENIQLQVEADPRPTGTDARSIQISKNGVPTGLVGIPLRYMYPSEVIDLKDLEAVVKLLVPSLITGFKHYIRIILGSNFVIKQSKVFAHAVIVGGGRGYFCANYLRVEPNIRIKLLETGSQTLRKVKILWWKMQCACC